MKKAALYSRVSTLEQANSGYSLNSQKEQLENYAKAMNFQVGDHYSDGGHSGGNMDRPQLKRLIEDVKNKKIDVVIVVRLDRLSRNQRNTLFLIEELFNKYDVGFISLQESFDTTTSFGRAMVGIISTFAQLERDTITERLFTGRVERAKKGLYSGHPNHPTGYDYIDGALIPNVDACVVKEIFERFADGESAYSIYNELSIRYPDIMYSPNAVNRILDNPVYKGSITFAGEIYEGSHEAIIDEETFSVVKNKRNKVSEKHKVDKTKRSSVLARKLFCGKCGQTMPLKRHYSKYNGKFQRSTYRYGYYVCNNKSFRYYKKSGIKCTQPNKNVEDINEIVFQKINALNFEKAKRNISRKFKKTSLSSELKNLDSQEKRLMDLYQLGSIDLSEIEKRIKKIRKERENLEKNDPVEINHAKIIQQLRTVEKLDVRTLSFKEQCEVIDTLIDRVTIDDNKLTITFNF